MKGSNLYLVGGAALASALSIPAGTSPAAAVLDATTLQQRDVVSMACSPDAQTTIQNTLGNTDMLAAGADFDHDTFIR